MKWISLAFLFSLSISLHAQDPDWPAQTEELDSQRLYEEIAASKIDSTEIYNSVSRNIASLSKEDKKWLAEYEAIFTEE